MDGFEEDGTVHLVRLGRADTVGEREKQSRKSNVRRHLKDNCAARYRQMHASLFSSLSYDPQR
jgi:hypothetical protein